jgi:hypothetical protein
MKSIILFALFLLPIPLIFAQSKPTLLVIPDEKEVLMNLSYHAKVYLLGKEGIENPQYSLKIEDKNAKLEKASNYYDLTIYSSGRKLALGQKAINVDYKLTLSKDNQEVATTEERFAILKPNLKMELHTAQYLYNQCANVVSIKLDGYDCPIIVNSISNGYLKQDNWGDRNTFTLVPNITENQVISKPNTQSPENKEEDWGFLGETGEEGEADEWILPNKNEKHVVGTANISVGAYINAQNIHIGNLIYRVVEPPKPEICLGINKQLANCEKIVRKDDVVHLKTNPDMDFYEFSPTDAKYKILNIAVSVEGLSGESLAEWDLWKELPSNTKWQKTKSKNKIFLAENETNKSLNIPIPAAIFEKDAPKCRISIKMGFIERINFEGQHLNDARFTEAEKVIYLEVEK